MPVTLFQVFVWPRVTRGIALLEKTANFLWFIHVLVEAIPARFR